ncbi:MAG: M48 family metalloprotease [Reyranellaceae bacterium]
MRRRLFMTLGGSCLVCGCAGAVHRLPQVSSDNLSLAQSEVQRAGGPPQRRPVSDDEVTEILTLALRRIRAPAGEVCREMATGVCQWSFRLQRDRSLNASAGPNGVIVVNRGVVEYAANEEEVALVIAHEMGHQAANHLAAGRRNQVAGAVVGAIVLGALGAAASYGSANSARVTRTAMEAGADIGGAIGRISFSKEQEREADYLAAVILYRSGVDLDNARGFLVTMAKASGQKETGMLDTHPAGPERIASWDRAVEEIKASNGRLPQRA